jgi:DHA1 family bicyclomycin/chloramphenicol resistance-like MFS transporter
VRVGCIVAAVTSIVAAVDAWTGFGGLIGLILPFFVFISASGLIAANSMASALNHFPGRTGAVSALMGSLQYGMGIIGSAAVGLLNDGTPRPMALVIALTSISGLLCALFLLPRGKALVTVR